MTGFVSNIRSKIPSNNTMPSRIVFLIEFLFDISCNIWKEKNDSLINILHLFLNIYYLHAKLVHKIGFLGTRNQPTNRFQLFFTNETCINENTSLLFYVYLVIKILFFAHFSARCRRALWNYYHHHYYYIR